MPTKFCLTLVVLLCVGPTFGEGPTSSLDPAIPYSAERSNAVTYDVDFSVVVTPPYKAKKLAVWLPIPQSDVAQEVSNSKLSTFPVEVAPQIATEETFGNRFAYFEFASPQGAQIVRHQFRVKVWELNWNVNPQRVQPVAVWPAEFDKYRRSEEQAVVIDDRFRDLLAEIVPTKNAPAADFGEVMRWVRGNFTYDHHDASLQASAEHALEKRRGHCSDYHGFCAAMGRALGVPTRVTYGINTFPKNSPSHCKLEAFLPPYGWVSFDVSETQKLVGEIGKAEGLDDAARDRLKALTEARLERGFRDNCWFLQTRGTDYELAPKASHRVAVVRTAYIEADGVPLADPDPADKSQTAFSWMTVQKFDVDRAVPYPFADWRTLETSNDDR
jgi:transglutaminase-like putative cysteine protease